jgi:hypothetical protein
MNPPPDLGRVYYLQLGSPGCTRAELFDLLGFMDATGLRPVMTARCRWTRSARASSP